MGKSKGTKIIFLLLLDLTYTLLQSVAIIVITNRKTSYCDNRENITINDIIKISHRPIHHLDAIVHPLHIRYICEHAVYTPTTVRTVCRSYGNATHTCL